MAVYLLRPSIEENAAGTGPNGRCYRLQQHDDPERVGQVRMTSRQESPGDRNRHDEQRQLPDLRDDGQTGSTLDVQLSLIQCRFSKVGIHFEPGCHFLSDGRLPSRVVPCSSLSCNPPCNREQCCVYSLF